MSRKRFTKLGVALAVPALMLSSGVELAAAGSTPLGETQILETDQSWQTCQAPVIENPYALFDDERDYVLAPGGSFEDPSAPGWQLSSGASIVAGDDAFTERALLDTSHSEGSMLRVAEGNSVISPAMCVDLNYPLFRFTSRAVGSVANSEILVEVVYPNAENPAFEEVKQFDGMQGDFNAAKWQVSSEIDLKPDLGGQQWGGRLVALRVTALSGAWEIDDVYVDPRRHS